MKSMMIITFIDKVKLFNVHGFNVKGVNTRLNPFGYIFKKMTKFIIHASGNHLLSCLSKNTYHF